MISPTTGADDASLIAMIADYAKASLHSPEYFEALAALEEALEQKPEFAVRKVLPLGRGTMTWAPQIAGQKMLALARDGGGAAVAVTWFRKVSQATHGFGRAVKALYGVSCKHPVTIGNGIVLIPFSELPVSQTRDWILDQHDRANQVPLVHGYKQAPTAALCREGTLEPLFQDPSVDFTKAPPAVWFDELDAAARLLALVPSAAPIEAAHWFDYDDPDLSILGSFGVSRYGSELSPAMTTHVAEVTDEKIAGGLTAYQRLKKSDRDRIDLALGRLVRSRCQFVPGSRAIDLAIALEVLFLNSDQGEHSYKISLRLARCLSQDPAFRRRLFQESRRLYEMRSTMVHAGRFSGEYQVNGESISAHDLIESVDRSCIEAIWTFLRAGGIPNDWKDVELS